MFRCSSSVYSSHDRPIIGRQGVEARKLGRPRRWGTSVLECHLVWICCILMLMSLRRFPGSKSMHKYLLFYSVQFSRSVVTDSLQPHEPRSTPGLPVHHQLPEYTQTRVHRVGDAIQPSHPLSSPSPPALRVFSSESSLCIRWPKYWSFNFNISPSNEHPGLISLRMD